jgi:hypothetical protein
MPSTLETRDIPLTHAKIPLILKTWKLKIGPMVTRGEVWGYNGYYRNTL